MASRLGILCYHRIIDDGGVEAAWPYVERGTAVRMSTFLAQLERVAEFADILSEHAALEVLAARRPLERPSVWVTFDDGYRDVLRAVPHLKTATLFVTTCITQEALPADAWYAVLLGATQICGQLDLGMGSFAFDLRHREGRARLVNGPERRRYLRADATAQAATVRDLADRLGATLHRPRCYVSEEELRALLVAGWSVGSHGVTHLPFDALRPDEVLREAKASSARLSAWGGLVRSLALPDGAVPESPDAVRAAGYECVLGLGDLPAEPGASIQPRFLVPDDPTWVRGALQPRIS